MVICGGQIIYKHRTSATILDDISQWNTSFLEMFNFELFGIIAPKKGRVNYEILTFF